LSSTEKKTARFLSAGACDSYVPYVRCIGWKPRIIDDVTPACNSTCVYVHELGRWWSKLSC